VRILEFGRRLIGDLKDSLLAKIEENKGKANIT